MVSFFNPNIEEWEKYIIILAITRGNGIKSKVGYLSNLVKKLNYSDYLDIKKLERYINNN